MKRSYYSSSIFIFCSQNPNQILGEITQAHSFDLTILQRDAWITQIELLNDVLLNYEGQIYFEFSIPRMGKRVDTIVIIGSVVFVIEFKVGASFYESADIDQVMDYALDLQNFHAGSHHVILVPILVATDAPNIEIPINSIPKDYLFTPMCCNANSLGKLLSDVLKLQNNSVINVNEWEKSGYKPTPTIIEATLALYGGHSVVDISRNDAAAKNISHTSSAIADIIEQSNTNSEKSIIFVTGVPGAGKTLVGLNVASSHMNKEKDKELYSVFLSGNGPLVKILNEALARDRVEKSCANGEKLRIGKARSEVKALIQNVHHFRDEGLKDMNMKPPEKVVVFDEAQRAWSKDQTVKFMREKKKESNFDMSEPEFLISCMDRHPDWATIICLVGGGQEINTGEAGIGEWIKAIENSFQHWNIYLSDRLTDSEYGAGEVIHQAKKNPLAKFIPNLHLQTSMRSFRSEKVSLFVKQLLDLEIEAAKISFNSIKNNYPIVLTRNIDIAKNWVRKQARGTERYGMVVSSQAYRLKPYSIDIRVKTDPVHWFLNSKDDVRSSYYLEDVVTEFDIQGLELDWVCMAWDADFRFANNKWENWSFRGNKWQRINKLDRQVYQKNAYRVLLTRARQGMVLFVPTGEDDDHTRPKRYYDSTYKYLRELGIREIN